MARESVMRVLREHFRPEFLNRVDDIVIFRPLAKSSSSASSTCASNDIRSCSTDRQITLELTDAGAAAFWPPAPIAPTARGR